MLYQVACQRQMGHSDWQCLRPVYERYNCILLYSLHKRHQTQCVSFIGDLSSAVVTCCGRNISVSRHEILSKYVQRESSCSVGTEQTNVTNDFRASKRRTCRTTSPLADIEPRSSTIRTTPHTHTHTAPRRSATNTGREATSRSNIYFLLQSVCFVAHKTTVALWRRKPGSGSTFQQPPCSDQR